MDMQYNPLEPMTDPYIFLQVLFAYFQWVQHVKYIYKEHIVANCS